LTAAYSSATAKEKESRLFQGIKIIYHGKEAETFSLGKQ
jgi:hypothetical protein